MNVKYLSAIVSTAICLLPGISYDRAIAEQQSDYACFLTTASGNTVNFSQTSLCGAQNPAPKLPATIDEAFLAEYKRNAMQHADVSDNLLANVAQSPQISSSQAQRVCSALKSGLSIDQIRQKQVTEIVEDSNIIHTQIITNLAAKYYCPNLTK